MPLAPGPEAVLGGSTGLGESGHGALKGVAVKIRHGRDRRSCEMLGIRRRPGHARRDGADKARPVHLQEHVIGPPVGQERACGMKFHASHYRCRLVRRYADGDGGAAQIAGADRDLAAIGFDHDIAHHGQSDAVSRRGRVGAHATGENRVHLVRRDPGSVIVDTQRESRSAVFVGVSDPYTHALTGPFACIVEHIAQYLHQIPLVTVKPGAMVDLHVHPQLFVGVHFE